MIISMVTRRMAKLESWFVLTDLVLVEYLPSEQLKSEVREADFWTER